MHFYILGITEPGEYIDDIMYDYDEDLEVESYIEQTRKELLNEERDFIVHSLEKYKLWVKDPLQAYNQHWHDNYKSIDDIPVQAREYFDDTIVYNYERSIKREPMTDNALIQAIKEDYGPERFDENDNLLSTLNPNAEYDWYVIGGRWAGMLYNKDDPETEIDECPVGKLDPKSDIVSYGIVSTKTGWVTKETYPGNGTWEEYVKKLIANLPEDYMLTVIDCHM